MAHFKKPPNAPSANYDLGSKPPHGVLKMRVVQMTWGPVVLWGEERLTIDSANKVVLPADGIDSGPYVAASAERLLQLFGRHPGTSKVVARLKVGGGNKPWTHPMEVEVTRHSLFRVHLDSRHMALNAHDLEKSIHFQMDETVTVPKDMKPDELIKLIKQKASNKKLNHLVFNCHGFVGQIEIFGKKSKAVLDESNAHLFAELKGLINTIWVTSCGVGYELCKKIADHVQCDVVGAQKAVPVTRIKLGKGRFDLHLGCSPTVASSGNSKPVEIGDFVMHDRRGSFRMEPAISKDPFSN